MTRWLALLFLIGMAPAAAQDGGADAPLANIQLADPQQEAAATTLMKKLRCIQCQGQSIADSDAPIAGAMRSEVRRRIKAGESPEAVRRWLISRYGEYVSFEPLPHGGGLFLWLAPIFLLFAGVWIARGLFAKDPV